ncbi:hypothetical protein GNY06_04070 [Elizabethkingia argentiflava]|uniref:Arm DNA-binding domain-containing protein n=1 Tax=Elizabethkingia argenteiflava TaxID=2681556 RepID=A0A845PU42_9FLAO|nr:hypothetical protein [Elizabethkingia argenteiflava]
MQSPFLFEKRQAKKDESLPVYCRITIDRKEAHFGMKKNINPKLWNVKEGKATGKSAESSEINVRRFKNNSLFQQLLSEFIDVKREEENSELIRPNKISKEYKIEQNDLTEEQYDLLTESFNGGEKGAILTHILNARKIAISPLSFSLL